MPELKIKSNYHLKKLNTFGIDARTRYFCLIENESDLPELSKTDIFKNNSHIFMGAGSNLLFSKDYDGLVISSGIRAKITAKIFEDEVLITSGSGFPWHKFVRQTLDEGFYGLENLAMIPGLIGAAPVQNIGAYGVEQKDLFQSLRGYDFKTQEFKEFSFDDCRFGYRYSIFKEDELKDFFITEVTYKLNRLPSLKLNYPDIMNELQNRSIDNPTPENVFDAICDIRQKKLPDYSVFGNAGSFFKNPVISKDLADSLKLQYPELKLYPFNNDSFKLSAGQLIESAGWKGYRKDDAGVSPNHALILINYGNASGNEILSLADEISGSIFAKFGVNLEKEVQVI